MKNNRLLLIVCIVCAASIQAQSIVPYSTVTSTMTGDSYVYSGYVSYDKTIGLYPDMTLSCHEAMTPSGKTCFLTVNRNLTANNYFTSRYIIQNNILIRDMVQHNMTDTIYFCGTRIKLNGDSVGIVGWFEYRPSGSFVFEYMDIKEVNTIIRLVTVKGNGYNQSVSLGVRLTSGVKEYSIIQSFMSTGNMFGMTYFFSPIHHSSTPFDLVATDKYVALASYDDYNLYLRKFNKDSISDNMKNTLYMYPLNNDRIMFQPHATFYGDLYNNEEENDIVVAFPSFVNNSWKVDIKTFDMNTMQMTCAQRHDLYEKDEILGMTYTPKNKMVALLECYDPEYLHFGSSIVTLKPIAYGPYVSKRFSSRERDYFYSISNIYSSLGTSCHYLVGYMGQAQSRVMINDGNFRPNEGCLNYWDINFDVVNPIQYQTIPNSMLTTKTGGALFPTYISSISMDNYPCSTKIRK